MIPEVTFKKPAICALASCGKVIPEGPAARATYEDHGKTVTAYFCDGGSCAGIFTFKTQKVVSSEEIKIRYEL